MNRVLVQNWLEKLADTASQGNIDAHMELISENVNVLDEIDKQELDYTGKIEYCRNRFLAEPPVRVSYGDMQIKTMTPARVKFVATETVEHPDKVNRRGLEFIIQREDDGCWRAVQERLFQEPEAGR